MRRKVELRCQWTKYKQYSDDGFHSSVNVAKSVTDWRILESVDPKQHVLTWTSRNSLGDSAVVIIERNKPITPVTKTNCSQQTVAARSGGACAGSIQVGRLIEPITCNDIQVSHAGDDVYWSAGFLPWVRARVVDIQ